MGTGTGSFGAKTDFATGGKPASVAIGDVNGDGKPDLAVATDNDNGRQPNGRRPPPFTQGRF
ncbi:MAG: VCBS repeat-containing protein [Chloroflexota bacterium]|nr:VCBS repeat-containing protein [Chloroflexota bacterium]